MGCFQTEEYSVFVRFVEGKDEENVRRMASWFWLDSDLS